jgi:hypothetical protein
MPHYHDVLIAHDLADAGLADRALAVQLAPSAHDLALVDAITRIEPREPREPERRRELPRPTAPRPATRGPRTSLAPEAVTLTLPREPSARAEPAEPAGPAGAAPRDQLVEILTDPMVQHALRELVPALKVSDVLPCLETPGLPERLFPHLSPAQCKLLGPELASRIAPHLALAWSQLAHIPLETLVLVPTDAFATMPAATLRRLPAAHQRYLAPYIKRVRNVNDDDHELVRCEALCQILHLHAHKILDPEHIPSAPQLRALHASHGLRAKAHALRWLVDAAMSDEVKLVQIGALKLTALIVELRRVGLRELAGELAQFYQEQKQSRPLRFGADGIAYTRDHVVAMRHHRVTEPGAIASTLREAVLRHASLRDADDPARAHDGQPLPTARAVPVIALDLELAMPRGQAQAVLEAALADQLGEPRLGITVEEVCVRWPGGETASYRRQLNARYRAAPARFGLAASR